MRRRPRSWFAAGTLAVIMAGAGGLAGPVSAADFHLNVWPWLELAAAAGSAVGLPGAMEPLVASSTINKGSDNRLVILLVGSDYRAKLAASGERTDTMMVVTIDNSRRISAVSIPRDVGNVPIAPGEIWTPRINGLFKHYTRLYGTRQAALEHLRQAISYAVDTPIDYVAYIRFTGFERMVGQVGGVPVAVDKSLYDSRIIDDRYPSLQDGAKFLASSYTLMRGTDSPPCYTVGNPLNWTGSPNCVRALEYVRSRHGPGNNDWVRARRQQTFVFAAIRRVLSRGSGTNLDALRVTAATYPADYYSSLPLTVANVLALYSMLSGATMPNQAVFKPPTYATTVPGTFKQQLRIDVVRQLMHTWFGPL